MAEQVANGVRLHYEERGEGGPILCIHGAGSSALAAALPSPTTPWARGQALKCVWNTRTGESQVTSWYSSPGSTSSRFSSACR